MQKLKAVSSTGALRPSPRPARRGRGDLLPCVVCGTYVPASRAIEGVVGCSARRGAEVRRSPIDANFA